MSRGLKAGIPVGGGEAAVGSQAEPAHSLPSQTSRKGRDRGSGDGCAALRSSRLPWGALSKLKEMSWLDRDIRWLLTHRSPQTILFLPSFPSCLPPFHPFFFCPSFFFFFGIYNLYEPYKLDFSPFSLEGLKVGVP